MNKFVLSSVLFLSAVVFVGCAEDSINVNVSVVYAADNVNSQQSIQNFVEGNATSVRVLFTYAGFANTSGTDLVAIQPKVARSVPENAPIFSEAAANGYTYNSSVSSVTLAGLPIGKVGTSFAIEWLAPLGDGTIGPIAYALYTGPAGTLSEDTLKAHLATPLTIVTGRTCGLGGRQQSIQTLSLASYTADCAP